MYKTTIDVSIVAGMLSHNIKWSYYSIVLKDFVTFICTDTTSCFMEKIRNSGLIV